ncbi:MAG: M42 family metallopeptidase [Caldisericaceae bacterium]|nr:M42 family metallopeptidase [Caldisericaceae bacterium]
MENLIKKLVYAFGPSSKENSVKKIIKEEILKEVDEVYEDNFGNLVGHIKGPNESLMLAAHMDQIGVMVTNIDKNGFLRVGSIGGLHKSLLVGQKILFEGGVEGFVYYEDKESPWEVKDQKLEKFYVDIGATSRTSAKKLVQIGTEGIYKPSFYVNGTRITAPALDDRIGCAVAIQLLKTLRRKKVKYDLYVVFTVQEEIGIKGAKVSSYDITPDIGIALDVTDAGDTPESPAISLALGKGPAIKIMDAGMIASKRIRTLLIDTAKKNNIPYQLEVITGGSTDAAAIQITKTGVESAAVSISTRYIHTPGETLDMTDVENAVKLLKKFIEK